MKKRGYINRQKTRVSRCPCCGHTTIKNIGIDQWDCSYCREGYKIARARERFLSRHIDEEDKVE